MKLRIGRRTGSLTLASVAAVTLSMIGGGPLAVAAAPTPSAAPHAAGYQPPKIGHVWTIILENKSYESTFTGLNQNDYLWKTLPSYGELLRQYYGTGHYSLDNYISLVAGQAPRRRTRPTARNIKMSLPDFRPRMGRRTPPPVACTPRR